MRCIPCGRTWFRSSLRRQRRALTGAGHHRLEHLRREAPRGGVVAAAMIRIDEPACRIECVLAPVAERERGAREPERHEQRIVSYPAERDVDACRAQSAELRFEVAIAAAYFSRQGLVLGRHALDRVHDADVDEAQSVPG